MFETLDKNKEGKIAAILRQGFDSMVIGQPEAITKIINVIEKVNAGIAKPHRPLGTLLFLGPTGTGKTQIVKTLAEFVTRSEDNIIRLDCGEFQHSADIAKLVGSPPGYLGHRETPAMLTQAAIDKAQSPVLGFTIVLFDEIEKASDALWHMMLGILNDARLSLGDGNVTNFDKCIIIMTSNAGVKEMSYALGNRLGFQGNATVGSAELSNIGASAAKKKFTPEFINRIDEIVTFNTLTKEDCLKIVDIELKKLQRILVRENEPFINLRVLQTAKDKIVEDGFNPVYNAREINREIEKQIQIPLARIISSEQVKKGDQVYVQHDGTDYRFERAIGAN